MLAGLWAGLQQPACCARARWPARGFQRHGAYGCCARPLCARLHARASALLSAALQAGARGEKRAEAALKGLPQGYVVLCNVPMQAHGRRTELDAAVVGPGGVCVVEVKHYAGGHFRHRAGGGLAPDAAGPGRPAYRKKRDEPHSAEPATGGHCARGTAKCRGDMPCLGRCLFFQTRMPVCMCARRNLCRAKRRFAAPCAALSAFRAASSARLCRLCCLRAGYTKNTQMQTPQK